MAAYGAVIMVPSSSTLTPSRGRACPSVIPFRSAAWRRRSLLRLHASGTQGLAPIGVLRHDEIAERLRRAAFELDAGGGELVLGLLVGDSLMQRGIELGHDDIGRAG